MISIFFSELKPTFGMQASEPGYCCAWNGYSTSTKATTRTTSKCWVRLVRLQLYNSQSLLWTGPKLWSAEIWNRLLPCLEWVYHHHHHHHHHHHQDYRKMKGEISAITIMISSPFWQRLNGIQPLECRNLNQTIAVDMPGMGIAPEPARPPGLPPIARWDWWTTIIISSPLPGPPSEPDPLL